MAHELFTNTGQMLEQEVSNMAEVACAGQTQKQQTKQVSTIGSLNSCSTDMDKRIELENKDNMADEYEERGKEEEDECGEEEDIEEYLRKTEIGEKEALAATAKGGSYAQFVLPKVPVVGSLCGRSHVNKKHHDSQKYELGEQEYVESKTSVENEDEEEDMYKYMRIMELEKSDEEEYDEYGEEGDVEEYLKKTEIGEKGALAATAKGGSYPQFVLPKVPVVGPLGGRSHVNKKHHDSQKYELGEQEYVESKTSMEDEDEEEDMYKYMRIMELEKSDEEEYDEYGEEGDVEEYLKKTEIGEKGALAATAKGESYAQFVLPKVPVVGSLCGRSHVNKKHHDSQKYELGEQEYVESKTSVEDEDEEEDMYKYMRIMELEKSDEEEYDEYGEEGDVEEYLKNSEIGEKEALAATAKGGSYAQFVLPKVPVVGPLGGRSHVNKKHHDSQKYELGEQEYVESKTSVEDEDEEEDMYKYMRIMELEKSDEEEYDEYGEEGDVEEYLKNSEIGEKEALAATAKGGSYAQFVLPKVLVVGPLGGRSHVNKKHHDSQKYELGEQEYVESKTSVEDEDEEEDMYKYMRIMELEKSDEEEYDEYGEEGDVEEYLKKTEIGEKEALAATAKGGSYAEFVLPKVPVVGPLRGRSHVNKKHHDSQKFELDEQEYVESKTSVEDEDEEEDMYKYMRIMELKKSDEEEYDEYGEEGDVEEYLKKTEIGEKGALAATAKGESYAQFVLPKVPVVGSLCGRSHVNKKHHDSQKYELGEQEYVESKTSVEDEDEEEDMYKYMRIMELEKSDEEEYDEYGEEGDVEEYLKKTEIGEKGALTATAKGESYAQFVLPKVPVVGSLCGRSHVNKKHHDSQKYELGEQEYVESKTSVEDEDEEEDMYKYMRIMELEKSDEEEYDEYGEEGDVEEYLKKTEIGEKGALAATAKGECYAQFVLPKVPVVGSLCGRSHVNKKHHDSQKYELGEQEYVESKTSVEDEDEEEDMYKYMRIMELEKSDEEEYDEYGEEGDVEEYLKKTEIGEKEALVATAKVSSYAQFVLPKVPVVGPLGARSHVNKKQHDSQKYELDEQEYVESKTSVEDEDEEEDMYKCMRIMELKKSDEEEYDEYGEEGDVEEYLKKTEIGEKGALAATAKGESYAEFVLPKVPVVGSLCGRSHVNKKHHDSQKYELGEQEYVESKTSVEDEDEEEDMYKYMRIMELEKSDEEEYDEYGEEGDVEEYLKKTEIGEKEALVATAKVGSYAQFVLPKVPVVGPLGGRSHVNKKQHDSQKYELDEQEYVESKTSVEDEDEEEDMYKYMRIMELEKSDEEEYDEYGEEGDVEEYLKKTEIGEKGALAATAKGGSYPQFVLPKVPVVGPLGGRSHVNKKQHDSQKYELDEQEYVESKTSVEDEDEEEDMYKYMRIMELEKSDEEEYDEYGEEGDVEEYLKNSEIGEKEALAATAKGGSYSQFVLPRMPVACSLGATSYNTPWQYEDNEGCKHIGIEEVEDAEEENVRKMELDQKKTLHAIDDMGSFHVQFFNLNVPHVKKTWYIRHANPQDPSRQYKRNAKIYVKKYMEEEEEPEYHQYSMPAVMTSSAVEMSPEQYRIPRKYRYDIRTLDAVKRVLTFSDSE